VFRKPNFCNKIESTFIRVSYGLFILIFYLFKVALHLWVLNFVLLGILL